MRAAPLLAVVIAGACVPAPRDEGEPGYRLTVAEAMSGSTASGFARADSVRTFAFPTDHGPHPEYRTEWWYFTGNLTDSDGGAFGFQMTIFRHALAPDLPKRTSDWASRHVWFAHVALGDAEGGRFHAFERFQRGALELSGVRAAPFTAWVGDWRVESLFVDETFPMRLAAEEDGVALDLVVAPEKPTVLQGDRGLSRKGPGDGNASYYYSLTRLTAEGTVTVDGIPHAVVGSAWLDREWSTSALSPGQVGWDWFAIQLADGRDLMLYRLRREDGTIDPFNSGILVRADGSTRSLGPDDVRYEPLRSWTSPRSGAAYPVEWKLFVEPLGMELDVRPMLEASELDLSVRYWEGAVRVSGRDRSGNLDGVGFLEMTGYDGAAPGGFEGRSPLPER